MCLCYSGGTCRYKHTCTYMSRHFVYTIYMYIYMYIVHACSWLINALIIGVTPRTLLTAVSVIGGESGEDGSTGLVLHQ